MDRIEHHAWARSLLAYLADTATSIEAALGYDGVLLELDRLAEPGALPPITDGTVDGRHDAYLTALDHLAAIAAGDGSGFQVSLCRAELQVVWRREQAG